MVENDLISVNILNEPLLSVMIELASQVGAKLYFMYSAGEKKVSASFDGLTLENALKTLLKGENYAVVYSGQINQSERTEYRSVESIYVFFSDSARFNSEPESGHRETEITRPRYMPNFQQEISLPDAVMSDLPAEQKEERLPVSAVESMD
jgi:hypothetical protein